MKQKLLKYNKNKSPATNSIQYFVGSGFHLGICKKGSICSTYRHN